MIKKHSDDPDVAAAARRARDVVHEVLSKLPAAKTYDYGGHRLALGDYDVCTRCTSPIAEAQAAATALAAKAEAATNDIVAEHLEQAAKLFMLEAAAAEIRAQFHNGQASEPILNELLAFVYQRNLHDSYDHSHHGADA